MTQERVSDLSVLLPSVLLTVMLAFFVLTDTYIGKGHRRVLLIVCTLIFGLIVQNHSRANKVDLFCLHGGRFPFCFEFSKRANFPF